MIYLFRALLAAFFSFVICFIFHKRRNLDKTGAILAFFCGLTAIYCGCQFTVVLLGFFCSSTLLTKIGAKVKASIDPEYKKTGNRNFKQVFACGFNGFIPAMVFIFHSSQLCPTENDLLSLYCICAYLGNFASGNADTWSSEIGVCSPVLPRLVIKPWKKVPRGVNGGVTMTGIVAGAFGGLFIGFCYLTAEYLCGVHCHSFLNPQKVLFITTAAGLFGTLIDSVIGGIFQASYQDKETKKIVSSPGKNTVLISGNPILSNEGVNFVETLITSVLTGIITLLFAKSN